MEYEINDQPQGERDQIEAFRDGGLAEDHVAIVDPSTPNPDDFPVSSDGGQMTSGLGW